VNNRYKIFGLGLCVVGAAFAPVSYFVIDSIPLTAVGISAFMIGISCIILVYTIPSLSPSTYQLMLKTGLENTANLLEGLGLSNRAVYLPSGMTNGSPQAVIPLTGNVDINSLKEIMPDRFLVSYGKNTGDMAVSVITPGTINMSVLTTLPGPTADEIETAINYILVEMLDIAESASVILVNDRLYIAVTNPKKVFDDTRYYQCMGSPIASIIASVSSEALGKPIMISEENPENEQTMITLEVLP
jgi:hypothetical protein